MKPRAERLLQERDRLQAKLRILVHPVGGPTPIHRIKVAVLRSELAALNTTIDQEDTMPKTTKTKTADLETLAAAPAVVDATGRVYVKGSDGSYLAGDDGESYATLAAVVDVNGAVDVAHGPTLELAAIVSGTPPALAKAVAGGATPPTTRAELHGMEAEAAEVAARTAEKPARARKGKAAAEQPAAPAATASASPEQVVLLPIDLVVPHPDNVRKHFDAGRLDELANSIQQHGIIQPLICHGPAGPQGEVQLIAGERRLRAARLAGLSHVPAIVREKPDDAVLTAAQLIENLQREDLDPLEEAAGYQLLVERGWSQHQIAASVGCGQGTVSKRLQLLNLAPKAAEWVRKGTLPIETALDLAKIDTGLQAKAIEHVNKAWHGHPNEYAIRELPRKAVELERQAKREVLVKEFRQRAKDEGVTLLKGGPHHYYNFLSHSDHRLLVTPAQAKKGDFGVTVAVKDHAKLSCHMAAIVQNQAGMPTFRYVCTDPASHATGADKKMLQERGRQRSKMSEAQRHQEERKAALAAAAAGRDEFVRQHLTGKTDKAAAQRFVNETLAFTLLAGSGYLPQHPPQAVGALVGVTVDDPWDTRPVFHYANESDVNLLRVTAASAYMLAMDALTREQTYGEYGTRYAMAAEWLTAIGYQATEAELEVLSICQGARPVEVDETEAQDAQQDDHEADVAEESEAAPAGA